MNLKSTHVLLFAGLALALPVLAACGGTGSTSAPAVDEMADPAGYPAGGPGVAGVDETGVLTPTVIARQEPPPTPTIDPEREPFAPVEVEALPGLVIPAAARLLEASPATAEEDAAVHLAMAGTDAKELAEWFTVELERLGWVLDEEHDGDLVFEHTSQLSARFAQEGLKRSATVLFEVSSDDVEEGEISIWVLLEAALAGATGS